jgi:hypothetical protein
MDTDSFAGKYASPPPRPPFVGKIRWIVAALEGAVVVGGISAVGAGLYGIGIPKNSILKYETSLQAGKFMLVVHGTADEVIRAKEILATNGASETELHMATTKALV